MKYTVDLERKEVIVYNYAPKWKKYKKALESIYGKKGFTLINETLNSFHGTDGIDTESLTSGYVAGTTGPITSYGIAIMDMSNKAEPYTYKDSNIKFDTE